MEVETLLDNKDSKVKPTPVTEISVPIFGVLCIFIAVVILLFFRNPNWLLPADWFAFASVVVATITLVAVYGQIGIAREQIELGKQELYKVSEDLKLNREASERANRHSILQLRTNHSVFISSNPISPAYAQLYLRNDGKATCHGFRLVICLPPCYALNKRGDDGWQDASISTDEPLLYGYTYFRKDFETVIYPDDEVFLEYVQLMVPLSPEGSKIFYRLLYADGQTPDFAYGYHHLITTFSPSDYITALPPRADVTLTITPKSLNITK